MDDIKWATRRKPPSGNEERWATKRETLAAPRRRRKRIDAEREKGLCRQNLRYLEALVEGGQTEHTHKHLSYDIITSRSLSSLNLN
jgi:hypothetical protein